MGNRIREIASTQLLGKVLGKLLKLLGKFFFGKLLVKVLRRLISGNCLGNCTAHCLGIWCAVGQKNSNFSTQFLKNVPSPEMIWNQKKCPTAHQKSGVQWDKRIQNFKSIFEKCSKPRDNMEPKKMSHCTPEIWCAVGQKNSNFSTQFLKLLGKLLGKLLVKLLRKLLVKFLLNF